MKNLELTQMNEVNGGSWTCAAAVGGLALTAVALTASGPVGWVAWGVALGRGFLTGGSIGACLYELNH